MATKTPAPTHRDNSAEDDALLEELRDRFEYATDEWADIRAEAATDMRYVAGDPWDPQERKDREAAGRPCLTQDELGQHFNQVINGVRANKRAIKFSATGNGATEQSAQFYTDHTREVEYRSHAQVVYTTAFQDAIHRSYGFCRVTTEYESDRSFNLQIALQPLVNPDMVYPDPDARRPDSSDQKYCFVIESRSHEEFKREYPQAKLTDFASLMVDFPQWVKEHRVLIAEYWTITTKKRQLLLIQPPPLPTVLGQPPPPAPTPIAAFEDELDLATMPAGASIVKQREVDYPTVYQYLTNGIEILKTTAWPGKYIPIASCYGMVLYVEGKRVILSMTRLARDPYMLFCYYRTCEAELVGMTPKTPYMAYEGQFSPDQLTEVQKSLHEPVAVLFAKATLDTLPGTVLPLPQRQPYEPQIQALEMGAESARRGIQSAMGSSPLPSSAQRRNEKSGVALQQIADTSQMGSFHFNDHYDDMIRFVGVIVEDLIDKVLDTARDVGVRQPNDTASRQRINDPTDPDSVSTKGDHSVTVSTGPAYESEREAESAFADVLMQSPFAPLIADLAVKLKGGGPTLDEIAERLTPPQFKKPKEGEGPDPQQLAQQAAQQGEQLQQAQQVIQQLQSQVQTDQAKQQAAKEIAQLEQQTKMQLAAAAQQAQAQIAAQQADLEREKLEHDGQIKLQIAAMTQETQLRLEEMKLRGMQMQAEIDAAENELARQAGHAQAVQLAQMGAAAKAAPRSIRKVTMQKGPDGATIGAHIEDVTDAPPESDGASV